jgi:hypothetical protein
VISVLFPKSSYEVSRKRVFLVLDFNFAVDDELIDYVDFVLTVDALEGDKTWALKSLSIYADEQ